MANTETGKPVVKKASEGLTAPEQRIQNQIDESGTKDARATGNLKAEQPILEEIPDTAEVVRGYAKWTDNDGQFHKVPIDGTNAVREPAHEQHELTVEDRDRLDQTLALKTPRREIEGTNPEEIHSVNVKNDEIYDQLQGQGVDADAPQEGPVADSDQKFQNATREVKVGTPASR